MRKTWRHDLRLIRWLSVATMAFLVGVLGVLAWLISSQESGLDAQRAHTYQESATDWVVAALHQELGAIDAALEGVARNGEAPQPARSEAAFLYASQQTVRAWPRERLAYFPDTPAASEPPAGIFDKAEELEYTRKQFAEAIAEFQRIAQSKDQQVRALALLGVARNQQNAGQFETALSTLETLHRSDDGIVAGLPASLAAQLAALSIHERRRDEAKVRALTASIRDALTNHRYTLSRASFVALREQLRAHSVQLDDTPAVALADAIAQAWSRTRDTPAGRVVVTGGGAPHLVAWRRAGPNIAVFATPAAAIPRDWLPSGAAIELVSDTGATVRSREIPTTAQPSIRLATTTGLPWTVRVASAIPADEVAAAAKRRRLMLIGLGVLTLFIAAGGWIVGRAVTRELTLARMQSNFVAGVSHEFRTPLTAIIQTSELLTRGRVNDDEERDGYYRALHAESLRLHRLVENLLMFGGLDAGQFRFKTDVIDVQALVDETVRQCIRQNPAAGQRIQIRAAADATPARGDREALQMMLANLIDNALKYSPPAQPVIVSVGRAPDGGVLFEVEDHGIGIPAAERDRIFDKFVRGAAAVEKQIRGTGVGLALARDIARAHGGDITVESEPGVGSRFVVRLA